MRHRPSLEQARVARHGARYDARRPMHRAGSGCPLAPLALLMGTALMSACVSIDEAEPPASADVGAAIGHDPSPAADATRPPGDDTSPDGTPPDQTAVDAGLDTGPLPAALCPEDAVETRACGLNGRGQGRRRCTRGSWSAWSCFDPDVCLDDEVQSRVCGDAGMRERRCVAGGWSDWSPCAEPSPCAQGEQQSRPCGPNDRGVEQRACDRGVWSPWSACDDDDACEDDDVEEMPCGLNRRGIIERRCVAGQWQSAPCDDSDVCLDDTSRQQPCGLNGRGDWVEHCADGQWRAPLRCNDPDTCLDGRRERSPCGLNGRGLSSRSCADGAWTAYGPCEDPDACVDGAAEAEDCAPGLTRQRVCVDGRYAGWGPCVEDAPCPADECPPDRCADPRPLEVGQPADGVTSGPDLLGQTCAPGGSPEAVFHFVAPHTGGFRIDTAGSEFDTVLSTRSVCPRVESEFACNDDDGASITSALHLPLDRGEAVYVIVDGVDDAGRFALRIDPEDACEDGDDERVPCFDRLGMRERHCDRGVWGRLGPCTCEDGARGEASCGLNERGVATIECVDGDFPDPDDGEVACDDPDVCVDDTQRIQPCEANGADGVQDETCVTGQWQAEPCRALP